tara:strand:- start:156 stop:317 length:162 start_codon:yes stop_codon:yes gene_type:complete
MSRLLILIMFFLLSCSSVEKKNNIVFFDNMTLKEFEIKLKEYVEKSSYPNIDK